MILIPEMASAFFFDIYVLAPNIPVIQIEKPQTLAVMWNEDFDPCSCVSYLKFKLGIPQSEVLGNAWDLKPNSDTPKTGSVILFDSHAGYVFYSTSEKVVFEEYNWQPCAKTVRTLPLDNESIRGYLVL